MERLLGAAKELSEKVDSNETAAGDLLRQCETLQEELKAMKQYRECLREVNGGDENRVHLPNIELSYIRQLQHDNSELRSLLEEHQAALEIIMGKYRQQMSSFMVTSEDAVLQEGNLEQELQSRTEQVYSMAAVMYKAAQVDDTRSCEVAEKVARLEYENKHLRELLQFSTPRDQLVVSEMPPGGLSADGVETTTTTSASGPREGASFRSNNSIKDSDIIR